MLALRQGEVLWRGGHFRRDALGSMDGLPGRMCNAGNRVPTCDYLRGDRWISDARRGGEMAQRDASDIRGLMEQPWEVAIGGQVRRGRCSCGGRRDASQQCQPYADSRRMSPRETLGLWRNGGCAFRVALIGESMGRD